MEFGDLSEALAEIAQLLTQAIMMPIRRRFPERRRRGDRGPFGGRVRGTLVAAGGTVDDELIVEMIHRGGGRRARTLILPAAHVDFQRAGERYIRYFTRFGMQRAEALPLAAREQADDREVADRIAAADIVFLAGGDTGLLLDVVGGTASAAALREALRRGAVVAAAGAAAGAVGSMAVDWSGGAGEAAGAGRRTAGEWRGGTGEGAATAGRTGEWSPRTAEADGRTAAAWHGETAAGAAAGAAPATITWRRGLGLLPGCVVDRQGVQRGRIGRFLAACATAPDIAWGLGIEEGAALVVQPGWQIEVHGSGPVLCVDARTLRPGSATGNGASANGAVHGHTARAASGPGNGRGSAARGAGTRASAPAASGTRGTGAGRTTRAVVGNGGNRGSGPGAAAGGSGNGHAPATVGEGKVAVPGPLRDPGPLLAISGAPLHVLPVGWRLDLRLAQILPPAPPAPPGRSRRR